MKHWVEISLCLIMLLSIMVVGVSAEQNMKLTNVEFTSLEDADAALAALDLEAVDADVIGIEDMEFESRVIYTAEEAWSQDLLDCYDENGELLTPEDEEFSGGISYVVYDLYGAEPVTVE